MTEIRKPVVGYESQYQVSDLGNVKSLNKGILMSPSTTPNGYSINHRKVLQYDLDGGLIKEWKNARIASETFGISHADIIAACRGYYTKNSRKYPVKSAYGYIWRYAN